MKLTEEQIEQVVDSICDSIDDHVGDILWDTIMYTLDADDVEYEDVMDISDDQCEELITKIKLQFAPKSTLK